LLGFVLDACSIDYWPVAVAAVDDDVAVVVAAAVVEVFLLEAWLGVAVVAAWLVDVAVADDDEFQLGKDDVD